MHLLLDRDQSDLRDTLRAFLAERAGITHTRTMIEDPRGFDRELWEALERELGVLSLVVPEQLGGSGVGQVERSIVCEELGRALVPSPYLASAVLATDVLVGLETPAATLLLKRIATGDIVACLADAPWTLDDLATASTDGSAWSIDGKTGPVLWGAEADVVVVRARTSDGFGWFQIEGSDPGLVRDSLERLDHVRRSARIQFRGATASPLATRESPGFHERIRALGTVALGSEQLGGMRRTVEATVDYAKERFQFGREIGSYQAVKHQLADMYSSLEQVESVVRYAVWAAEESPEELAAAADLVTAYVGPAYFAAASNAVRLHGGLGYTWEHHAHLFYKHAKGSELLMGTPAEARQRIATQLLAVTG
ncbi:acyl-CoA dehydrogenase family protein [Rhodococcus olei]|uniref:Acyl-CoA dehydrogenase family protein n=1 Tax=Rhodococcus olei TaxID=2161675 RepID=A0ABP8NWI4_9NOCA